VRNNQASSQLELFKTPVKVELHAIQIPFFRLDKNTGGKAKMPPLVLKDGKILIPRYMPGYRAKKLFTAMFMKISNDLRNFGSIKIPVEFASNSELRKILGRVNRPTLRRIAIDLTSATFVHVNLVRNVKTGEYLESYEPFHLIEKIVLAGDTYKDPRGRIKVAENVMITPAKWIVDNLESFYVHIIDFDLWNSLPPISQRLYEILSYNFYANKLKPVIYNYSTLVYIMPMKPQKYFSNVMRILEPRIDILRNKGYISDFRYRQIDKQDWQFIFIPGPLAKTEAESLALRKSIAKSIEEKKPDRRKEITKMLSEMPDLPNVDADDIRLMVQDILEVTGDRYSKKFYELVARKIPHNKLKELLSILKSHYLITGKNNKSPGAVFVGMVKEWVKKR